MKMSNVRFHEKQHIALAA